MAPLSLALLTLSAGCANGVTSGAPGGGGAGGSVDTTGGAGGTTSTTGGAGSGGDTGGAGGMTTTTTSSTTTTTTTTTTTSSTTTTTTTSTTTVSCPDPTVVAGYGAEQESNAIFATANVLQDGGLGFTATICPAGDIDVFAVPIVLGGGGLRVEVKGPGAGCPAGSQVYVRIFDQGGALIAADAPFNGCSVISPLTDNGVASLAAGTYYVQIENVNFSVVDAYLVDVKVTQPSCGDGITQGAAGEQCDDGNNVSGDGCTADCLVEAVCGDSVVHVVAGEQCDDGNTIAGDGCSPTCQFEAVLLTETEPNGQATPNCLAAYDGAVGAIMPAGDQDWFCIEVPVAGSTITVSTSDGLNDCPSGADTKIYLYNSANTLVASDDDDGAGTCSLISPANDASAANLPAGTYTIMVEDYGNNDVIDSYVLLAHVSAPGCGDSLLQANEQCDDGNTTDGDGCSSTCAFEANFTHELEPNTLVSPNSLVGFDGVIASISPAGDTDAFSFDVTVPGSSVVIEVSDGLGSCPSFDSIVTLYDLAGMVLVTDDDGGDSPCSKIDPTVYAGATNLAVGTYKVQVSEAFNSAVPQYVLTVKVQPPACGDSLVGGGEQCDDGNATPGDGCSDTCQAEAPWEIEPNGTLNEATGIWPGFNQWRGSIKNIGDHDWYKFTVAAGQSVRLETHTIGDALSCAFDSKIHLINAAGTQILEDDDDGVGTCSLINPAVDMGASNLAAGAYYVWVQHFSDGIAAGPYQLDITIQ